MSDLLVSDQNSLRSALTNAYEDLRIFFNSLKFQELLSELNNLPEDLKTSFVKDVILNSTERKKRGLVVPDDILIEISTFRNGRKSYFCIRKRVFDRFNAVITYPSASHSQNIIQ